MLRILVKAGGWVLASGCALVWFWVAIVYGLGILAAFAFSRMWEWGGTAKANWRERRR